jgi:hypothetical protein
MDDRTEGRKYSALDWPTPEMLAEANRLRAQAFKEMAVDCGRWLKRWLGERLPVASRSKASPAKVRIAGRR